MQLMHHVCRLIFLQPGEMSLEEIEERLSSSVKAETISQLKSTVWKERLEG
jgi:cytoskeleton-associated protein 5